MRKVYYQYDPKTRVYKRVYPTFGQKFITFVYRIVIGGLLGGLFFAIYYFSIKTPSLVSLIEENSKLISEYRVLSRKVDDALLVLSDIEQRDDNLYRVLLEADPIPELSRQTGYSGTNRYAELLNMPNSELIVNTAHKADLLEKKLYMQTRSFDEVVEFSREQEQRIESSPAIQPVANKDLKRTASGYGYRNDPVYHVRKFHYGMDFACDTGTPVYATADGVITYAKWKTAYGNLIEIDHGYGYVTRYAHLSKIDVKAGQTISRGEVIGEVGSTGKSTGPHLHYEVLVNGKNVNPVNYYFMDLNAEQYEQMIQMAENHGKVFD
jgi:murein DD-endopeptidase MepM/ murein hydrolase activator NlpD